MTTNTTTEKRVHCPSCAQKAKRVGTVTLRAMLKERFASRIVTADDSNCDSAGNGESGCQPISGDTGWRFCGSKDCDVVYFAERDDTAFTKSQLRVAVGEKETTGERLLCYCFGHSVASIKEELQSKGRSDAQQDIRAKMKDPGCRCETENPSGSCCLGSVTKAINIAHVELGMIVTDVLSPPTPASSLTNKGETIAKIGTLFSAIMASACCWLPLVLLAVGVSGAGIASTLEAYRPLFIVVTFGFLGAAFYLTYRPKKTAAADGHDCCTPNAVEDCCAPAMKGRFSMMTLNKVMLWVVTVLAVAFLFFPSYVGTFIGRNGDASVSTTMNLSVLKIDGMTCDGCAAIAEKALRDVCGVQTAQVDFKKREAVVGTDVCCPVPETNVLAALEEAGFRGVFITPDPSREDDWRQGGEL